jgi:hypothetical protein
LARPRAKLNGIAARKTRPAKPRPRSLTQLREDWHRSARAFLADAAGLIDSLLERARAAAAVIRARVAAVVDVGLAAVAVTATVFVMNSSGHFHRRQLLAEPRRHLALVQRGRRREMGLDETIVNEALAAHCTDITEARTEGGEEAGYHLYTARWAPTDPPPSRTSAAAPRRDRKPAADPAAPFLPMEPGEWGSPRVPLCHVLAVIAARVLTARLRTARRTGRPPTWPRTNRPRQPSNCSSSSRSSSRLPQPRRAAPRRTAQGLRPACAPGRHRQRTTATRSVRRAHREDDQRAHQPHQPGPGQSPGANR